MIISKNNPVAMQQPLNKGQNLPSTKYSPLIREYRCNRGGLSTTDSNSQRTGEGLSIPELTRIIPANIKLKPRANKMSRNMTKSEQLIWFNVLSKKQLLEYKFIKQKQIFHYILDFYCSELLLAIEVDGETHCTPQQMLYDETHTQLLNSPNIKVIRVSNHDIQRSLESVRAYLGEQIKFLQSVKTL